MQVIAVTNQKGGSAKTTTTVCLAEALSVRGRRVLVIDLDPQASASKWLGCSDPGRAPLETFVDEQPLEMAERGEAPALDVVASSRFLGRAERMLVGEVGAELVLRDRLRLVARAYDFVLIDCPPSLGLLTYNAMAAATAVLVTVEASALAVSGVPETLAVLEQIKRHFNRALSLAGVLVCRHDQRRRVSHQIEAGLRRQLGSRVLRTIIRENCRLLEAYAQRVPIARYAPRSFGAEDYRTLAAELEARCS